MDESVTESDRNLLPAEEDIMATQRVSMETIEDFLAQKRIAMAGISRVRSSWRIMSSNGPQSPAAATTNAWNACK